MNKLITYFKNGKGRGLYAMLIFTTLIGLFLWGITYAVTRKLPEDSDLNEFINQLPTITIQNDFVVEPANTNATYSFKGYPIFYLQTDRNEVSPFSADGIYLTRKMLAIVSGGQIQKSTFLYGNVTLTPELIIKILRIFAIWTPIILGIFYFGILWLFYLIVTAISSFIVRICHLKLNKGCIWRSASFSTIVILLIDIIMGIFGYSISKTTYPMITQLTTSVLLVLLIAFGISEKK